MKRKENSFSLQWEKELSLRINVHKDWLRDHSSRVPCGIEMLIRGILKSCFWISFHQGMLSILCFRIQSYMLSLMNEVDPYLLLLLCVLYEMQNQIFQQKRLISEFLILAFNNFPIVQRQRIEHFSMAASQSLFFPLLKSLLLVFPLFLLIK